MLSAGDRSTPPQLIQFKIGRLKDRQVERKEREAVRQTEERHDIRIHEGFGYRYRVIDDDGDVQRLR
jgi:hypothetical protein